MSVVSGDTCTGCHLACFYETLALHSSTILSLILSLGLCKVLHVLSMFTSFLWVPWFPPAVQKQVDSQIG